MLKTHLLPPHAFLCPDLFLTEDDLIDDWADHPYKNTQTFGDRQYQKGLNIGKTAKHITITPDSKWVAIMKDGRYCTSHERIGYHVCTADLLQGFLDSGVEIRVLRYRWSKNLDEMTIIQK